jgi:hypothetical protein
MSMGKVTGQGEFSRVGDGPGACNNLYPIKQHLREPTVSKLGT